MRWIWAVLCGVGVCAFPSFGADGMVPRFRSDASLVLVSATVLDRSDKFVMGLNESNFQLFEGKDERRIVSVTLENTPVSVGIVFDASGSMKKGQRNAVAALREFLQSADPRDEFCVFEVRDAPEMTLDFTPDAGEVERTLAASSPLGATALIDSVYLAATHMKKAAHQRRMLLVISDGEDNNSRYSRRELKSMLQEANVTVYSIGVGVRVPPFFYAGVMGGDLLSEMSETTGGRYFQTSWPADLPDIMRKIDIRYQYVIGFAPPPRAADERYRRVQLKVSGPGKLRAYWRPGYRY